MFLSVKELEVKKIGFDVEFPPGEILFEERGVRQISPLRAEGQVELLNNTLGEIRVQGKMAVDLEMECDRCLDPTQHRVANEFDLYYRPAPIETAHHEVALDEGESQIGFYEGDGMELGDVLHEHILLSLPMRQVCREDCLGICPQCGANRNNVECHCEMKLTDDRWAALRELRGLLGSKSN